VLKKPLPQEITGVLMNLEQVRYVDDAITSRHSVRAFLNTPVETQLIQDILAVASRAPSYQYSAMESVCRHR
jgi:hypothetical protein